MVTWEDLHVSKNAPHPLMRPSPGEALLVTIQFLQNLSMNTDDGCKDNSGALI